MSTIPETAQPPALSLFKLIKRLNGLWRWTEGCEEDRVKTVIVAAPDEAAARAVVSIEIDYVNACTGGKRGDPDEGVSEERFACEMIAPASAYSEPTVLTVETFFAKREGHRALWKKQFDKCGNQRYPQYDAEIEAFARNYHRDYKSPQYDSDCVHSD